MVWAKMPQGERILTITEGNAAFQGQCELTKYTAPATSRRRGRAMPPVGSVTLSFQANRYVAAARDENSRKHPARTMNYPHYQPDSDHRPLTDEEIPSSWTTPLAATGRDEALNVEALDGFLAACCSRPCPARKTWRRLAARHLGRR